jgi:hypothetical protein
MHRQTGSILTAIVVGVVLTAAASSVRAGPWIPEPGEGYAKLSAEYFDATGVYDEQGDPSEPSYEYSHRAVRLYTDIGVAPHLGVSASVPFVIGENRRPTDDGPARYVKRGFGDLDLELQTGTEFGALALGLAGRVRIPLYDETVSADAPNPLRFSQSELRQRRFLPALGDGSVDVTPLVQVGLSLHPLPMWLTASVGPKFRFQGFGDGLQYAVGAGAFVAGDHLAVQTRVGGVQRFSDDNRRPTKSYLQVSGGPLVRVAGPLSFEAAASYIPTGAFVSKGWSVSAGVSYDGRIFPDPFAEGAPGDARADAEDDGRNTEE